jgi:hypothetical protein
MVSKKPQPADIQFDKMLEEIDELVHEAERVRFQIEESLRNRQPFWPERRRAPRWTDKPVRRSSNVLISEVLAGSANRARRRRTPPA